MCGIAGIISTTNQPVDKRDIEAMTDAVTHRGPDAGGYFLRANFAFGHRRLAIIDLSPAAGQPMHYRDRYTIIANGEIYNYVELREDLKKSGYRFRSQSDTEVILAAYDKWGEDCINYFNGMWAFALYDSGRNTIFCSRDRFGIKPFYYARVGRLFLFASEIKQFTTLKGWKARLNRRRAQDFLHYGIKNHVEETLLEDLKQLPGGHKLTYDLTTHQYSIKRWYRLESLHDPAEISLNTARDNFAGLFTDAVRLRLRADVKVGSCLSGGLDSSSIVCVVNHLLGRDKAQGNQETVSSCFNISRFDEQRYIDDVAQKTGITTHRVYPCFDDMVKMLDKIIWQQDEPFVSTSIFAQWEVFREAADRGITVMLDGQGADELLSGYPAFYGKYLAGLLFRLRLFRLAKEMKSISRSQNLGLPRVTRMLLGNLPPAPIRQAYRKLAKSDVIYALNGDATEKYPEPWQKPTRTMREESIAEILSTHLPILLHYEDRDSMAHSVESRLPFLDYRLVEFVLGLPDDHKINRGMTKFILREALRDAIPDSVLNRSDKMGFVTPEEVWLRKNDDFVRDELEATIRHSNGLVNRKIIDIHEAILRNRRRFDFTVWRFIAFGRWLKVFNVAVEKGEHRGRS